MAAGRKNLRKVQLGLESPSGTAVAATTIWRGPAVGFDDLSEIVEVEEQVGILDGLDRDALSVLYAGMELPDQPVTYEQFPHILAMAYGGPVTGVADGAGTGKVYTTTIPTTAAPTGKTYTVEGGDDAENEEMEYAHCTAFTVKGEHKGLAMFNASLRGRQVSDSTVTPALSIPTVEDAVLAMGKVYIDAIGGTYGTTQVSAQILAFEITHEIMWVPKWAIDGNKYFSHLVYAGHKITGKLTFEHDTAVKRSGGAKSEFEARTAKKLRISLLGSALTTPATHATKKVNFDMPIKYIKVGTLDEMDGNDIVDMEFRSRYNATAADQGSIVVVNQVTALP